MFGFDLKICGICCHEVGPKQKWNTNPARRHTVSLGQFLRIPLGYLSTCFKHVETIRPHMSRASCCKFWSQRCTMAFHLCQVVLRPLQLFFMHLIWFAGGGEQLTAFGRQGPVSLAPRSAAATHVTTGLWFRNVTHKEVDYIYSNQHNRTRRWRKCPRSSFLWLFSSLIFSRLSLSLSLSACWKLTSKLPSTSKNPSLMGRKWTTCSLAVKQIQAVNIQWRFPTFVQTHLKLSRWTALQPRPQVGKLLVGLFLQFLNQLLLSCLHVLYLRLSCNQLIRQAWCLYFLELGKLWGTSWTWVREDH